MMCRNASLAASLLVLGCASGAVSPDRAAPTGDAALSPRLRADAAVRVDEPSSQTDASGTASMADAAVDARAAEADVRVAPPGDAGAPDNESPQTAPSSNSVIDVWIPEGVPVLRGALVATHHHKLNQIPYQSWRVMCKAWGFAYIGTNHEFLAKDTDPFFEKLDRIAVEKGHPELKHVPLVCRGFSAGGGACIRLAKRRASRVIAVVSNGNPGSSFEDTTRDTFKTLPVLTVNGSVDPFVGGLKWITEIYWAKVRSHDLAWGLAVLWGGAHSWGDTNFLLYPFLDRVIQQRLPAQYDPARGPAVLRPVKVTDGWLGDMDGWLEAARTETPRRISSYTAFTGDRSKAAWLPDAYVASVWRAVSVSAHPLAFVKPSPGSTNTSNTIAIVPADGPMEVELKGAPDGTRVYAGDLLLGKTASGRLTVAAGVLSPGYHALLAFSDGPEGERAALPRQIYVGNAQQFGADGR